MEKKEAPARKYKKHKEGFKIAVEHKLNSNLKGTVYGKTGHFPVYIEVRAKRQTTFFPSEFISITTLEGWDNLDKWDYVKAIMKIEANIITHHMENYIKAHENDFKIKEWLNSYKEVCSGTDIGILEHHFIKEEFEKLSIKRGLDFKIYESMLHPYYSLDRNMSLIYFLKEMGVKEVEIMIEVKAAYDRLDAIVNNLSIENSLENSSLLAGTWISAITPHLVYNDMLASEVFRFVKLDEKEVYLNDLQLVRKSLIY